MSALSNALPPHRATGRWGQRLLSLAAAAFGAFVVYYVTNRTSSGATPKTILFAVFAFVPLWLFRTRRETLALAIGICYLGLLDGFLRLETGSHTLTMSRDLFIYAPALGMLIRTAQRRERWQWPPLTLWVIGWIAFVCVQLFNPASGPTLHRLIATRQDLEFVPLFFIAYVLVRSRERLRAVLMLLLVISAVNGAVGTYQSTLSPNQLAGWGSGYSSLIKGGANGAPTTAVGANGKQVVRPPALGGDMGFAGALGMIALPGGIGLLLTTRRRRQQLLLLGLIGLTTMGVITALSRANLISTVVGLLAFAAMLAASREGRRVLLGLLVFAAVAAVAVSSSSGNSLQRYSTISPTNIGSTVTSSRAGTTALIPKYLTTYPFGAGIGASGPAWGQYGSAQNTVNGESQITFLIGEVGIPGLIVFIAFQIKTLGGAVRRIRRIDDSEMRILLAAVIAPLFAFVANWYVGINTTSPPNAPFLWGAIGIIAFWLFSGRAPIGKLRSASR